MELTADEIAGVPEALRGLFTETDGKFVFQREDTAGLKSALQKERAERAARDKELARFKGIDPDDYATLKARDEELRQKKLIDEGKVEELLNERIGRAKTEWEKERESLTNALKTRDAELDRLLIDKGIESIVLSANTKYPIEPSALEEIQMHARFGKFPLKRTDDGRVVVMDGDRPRYGKDGKEMEIEEWLGDLAAQKPHLFKQSKGAGTTKGTGGGTPTVKRCDEMSDAEKAAFIEEHGEPAYREKFLRERASKPAKPLVRVA